METKRPVQRIYNRKLAKRIADSTARLREIRSKVGDISAEDARTEKYLQEQITADAAMLNANGYDVYGKKILLGNSPAVLAAVDRFIAGAK